MEAGSNISCPFSRRDRFIIKGGSRSNRLVGDWLLGDISRGEANGVCSVLSPAATVSQ